MRFLSWYVLKLNLSGCSSITEFPKVSNNIKELYLNGTAIREIPSSIDCLFELAELHLRNCKQFEILPSSICTLRKLRRLNLSGCLQFRDFPEVLEPMVCLRYLYLEQTSITKLPSPIGNLKGLACLEVGNCKYLDHIACFGDLQLPKRCMDLDCLRKHGDSDDLYCYLHGWYDEKRIDSDHILVGFDPCLVAKEDYMFSKYSEVSVEFQPEDMNGNLLPLEFCQIHECGLHLLYEDGIQDRDGLEAMFQAKRERFQSMRWEDYNVMRRTYEFLVRSLLDFQLYSGEFYRLFLKPLLFFFFFLLYLSRLILKRCYLNCFNRRSPMFQKEYLVSATMEM